MDHIYSCKLQSDPMMEWESDWHRGCKCWCHDRMLEEIVAERYEPSIGTNVIFRVDDSDISDPPDETTWYPVNDPNASWNLPK